MSFLRDQALFYFTKDNDFVAVSLRVGILIIDVNSNDECDQGTVTDYAELLTSHDV